jgi:hypothetical protein
MHSRIILLGLVLAVSWLSAGCAKPESKGPADEGPKDPSVVRENIEADRKYDDDQTAVEARQAAEKMAAEGAKVEKQAEEKLRQEKAAAEKK